LPRNFTPLNDLELDALDDDALIAYIRRARDMGHAAAARLALRVLVFGHMDNVERRVRMKVPQHAVDDVAGEAFDSAFVSAFDGNSVGEFRSWLNTIVNRRIADYHRRPRTQEQAMPPADEDDRGAPPELSVEPDTGAVEAQSVVDQAMAELSPLHERVVDLSIFSDGQPGAAEVAERITAATDEPMTAANVYQITSRFRKRVKELLAGGGDTPGQDE
jgi:RNA polymerase sigma factor (sigma-70 family)